MRVAHEDRRDHAQAQDQSLVKMGTHRHLIDKDGDAGGDHAPGDPRPGDEDARVLIVERDDRHGGVSAGPSARRGFRRAFAVARQMLVQVKPG